MNRLRALHQDNRAAAILFDEYANRKRNKRVTNTDWVARLVREQNVQRSEVIQMFRTLENIGCGKYVEGRKGKPSRFDWTKSSLAVCQLAIGERKDVKDADLQAVGSEAEEPEADLERHTFRLRSDLVVDLDLPSDLTISEAERLSKFVLTIPRGE